MSPLASQLALLPLYLLIVAGFVLVWADLRRELARRVDEDTPPRVVRLDEAHGAHAIADELERRAAEKAAGR